MKIVYPVIISKGDKFFIASVPDCEIDTQGESIVDAIEMARDAICLWCICQEDEKRTLPTPSELADITYDKGDIVTLVDADLAAYRRMLDMRTVRKNLTLPGWLNEQAEKAGVNFSQVLQKALKEELQIAD